MTSQLKTHKSEKLYAMPGVAKLKISTAVNPATELNPKTN